jgi:RimJ/RimL family protein N-acetyltransferase
MAMDDSLFVFETKRLVVRLATSEDAGVFYSLWTNPEVMRNVGFPEGLPTSLAEIEEQLLTQAGSCLERMLVVQRKSDDQAIGECSMKSPDRNGVSETDVKLLPQFWGCKYGVEVKQGLLDYLFTHTDCVAVQATPNTTNLASIHMQEAVGGVCTGEGVYEFPESMRSFTQAVHYKIYRVFRTDWDARQLK